jgi:hypothetical protein
VRKRTSQEKIHRFMVELGKAVKSPGRVYFTGGVSAVLLGWRETTLDLDLKADPEPAGFFEALPRLKESVDMNIELASPEDFVPALPGWEDRSAFIAKEGPVIFLHYDFYGQALSKLERLHERDRFDIQRMLEAKLVKPDRFLELFLLVESKLIRYPAIDPAQLRARVEKVTRGAL